MWTLWKLCKFICCSCIDRDKKANMVPSRQPLSLPWNINVRSFWIGVLFNLPWRRWTWWTSPSASHSLFRSTSFDVDVAVSILWSSQLKMGRIKINRYCVLISSFVNIQLLTVQGFYEISLMVTSIATCCFTFKPINETAFYLILPYLIWSIFYTSAIYSIWRLNSNRTTNNKFNWLRNCTVRLIEIKCPICNIVYMKC